MILAGAPQPVQVDLTAAGYVIAGHRLPATSPGVYEGSGAALVILEGGGRTRAAASTSLNGEHMTGRCTRVDGARTESCQFRLGSRRLEAIDMATSAGWHRRYDDGRTVEIRTSGARAVPVPFAVGR